LCEKILAEENIKIRKENHIMFKWLCSVVAAAVTLIAVGVVVGLLLSNPHTAPIIGTLVVIL